MSNPHSNEPLNNLSVRKSHDFTTARYSSSLLENQIIAISLTRIENTMVEDSKAPLVAHLYPGELKRLVSDPAHIYRDLKVLSNRMTSRNLFIEDGKGNFESFSIVTNASYVNGILEIKFNESLRKHVFGLEKNYTTYQLSVMTSFKKVASFRLYEILKKDIYKIKPNDFKSSTQVEYNLIELRFIIGLANADDPRVKNAFSRMNSSAVDWDELYDRLDKKDKKYEEWRDFQRRIIVPAQEELEEKSDIRFEFEGIREGRKTKRILFTIYRNIPKTQDIIDEKSQFIEERAREFRQREIPMDLPEYEEFYGEYVGHNNLTKEDVDVLLRAASFDKDKVREAIAYTDTKEVVNNYMGYIIKCIEGNYTTTGVIQGSSEMYEVIDKIHKESNSEATARRVWEKAKQNPDFDDFLSAMADFGLDLESLEAIYSCQELHKAYVDNKLGRRIKLFD